jgi:glycosyltransferase involved in cell wall biosynthesis
MKVLYDFEIFTKQSYGGVSRYFFEIINGLSKNFPLDTDIFLGINNSGYDFGRINKDLSIIQKKLRYPKNLHFLFFYINKYWFNKYITKHNCDILHKTYYSNIGLNLKSRIVSTVHDMTHELYPGFFAKSDDTSRLKRICARESDALICVSETTKKDIINIYGTDAAKIKVIYHGITLKNNDYTVRQVNKPYFLYVGQRWGYKNFNTLLSAYSADELLNNNFLLVCFGGGNFNLSEKVFIKQKKLDGKVIHLSGNDDLLVSLYRYADLFIYTSFYEGFGFPPLEAMKCGCPVVTSPGGSVHEVLGDSAVYFDPSSGEDLLEKIHSVIDNGELCKNLILKGLKTAGQFTWEKSVLEHFNYYNKIL